MMQAMKLNCLFYCLADKEVSGLFLGMICTQSGVCPERPVFCSRRRGSLIGSFDSISNQAEEFSSPVALAIMGEGTSNN